MRSRFPGSRRVGIGVLALVLVALAVELGVRLTIGHHVAGRVRDQLDARSVSIDIGGTPFLLDLARNRIATVHAQVRGADLCQLRGVDVDATLHDVSLIGARRVASMDATVTVPIGALQDMVAGLIGFGGVTFVPDPADHALTVSAGPGGLVRASVVPTLTGDTVRARVASVSLGGLAIPGETVDRLVGSASTRSLGDLPLGLHARDLTVTSTGLRLRLHGGPSAVGDTRVVCPT